MSRKWITAALVTPVAATIALAGSGAASAATGTGSSGSSDSSPVQTVVVDRGDLQLAGIVVGINGFEAGASVDRTRGLQNDTDTIGFAGWVGSTGTGNTVLVVAINNQLQVGAGVQHVG